MTEDGMALAHNAACQASAKSGWQKYFRGEWIKLNLRWLCWWWTQLLCTISKSRQFTRPKVASHSTSKKRHEWNIAPKIAAVHKFLMKNAFNLSFFISISISTPTTGDVSLRLRPPSSECSKMKKKPEKNWADEIYAFLCCCCAYAFLLIAFKRYNVSSARRNCVY